MDTANSGFAQRGFLKSTKTLVWLDVCDPCLNLHSAFRASQSRRTLAETVIGLLVPYFPWRQFFTRWEFWTFLFSIRWDRISMSWDCILRWRVCFGRPESDEMTFWSWFDCRTLPWTWIAQTLLHWTNFMRRIHWNQDSPPLADLHLNEMMRSNRCSFSNPRMESPICETLSKRIVPRWTASANSSFALLPSSCLF